MIGLEQFILDHGLSDEDADDLRSLVEDARPAPPTFPVDTYLEAAVHLRRPFTAAAVKWKVQQNLGPKDGPTGALIVGYIDARLVVERINHVCPHLWTGEDYRPVPGASQLLVCELTIDGITRKDVGQSGKGLSKDLWSDAFKRAAVKFGVGVSIYALPRIRLNFEVDGKPSKHVKYRKRGDKHYVDLTDYGQQKLSEGYQRWLEEVGIEQFGEPLDHGDLPDAQGDPDEGAPPAGPQAEAPQEPVSTAGLEDQVSAMAATVLQERMRVLGLTVPQVRTVLAAAGVDVPGRLTAAQAGEAVTALTVPQAENVHHLLDDWSERHG